MCIHGHVCIDRIPTECRQFSRFWGDFGRSGLVKIHHQMRLHDEISKSQAQLIIHCLDAMDRSDPMVCKPLSHVIKHLHFTTKFTAKLDIRSNKKHNRS